MANAVQRQVWCLAARRAAPLPAPCSASFAFFCAMPSDSSNLSPFAPPFFIAKCTPSEQQVDAWADQSLLDSLEGGGVNWPSSCRNGTCRTCLGQLVSGQVHYEIEWPGLSAEEKAEGYVLPCCAYPDSDIVLRDPF